MKLLITHRTHKIFDNLQYDIIMVMDSSSRGLTYNIKEISHLKRIQGNR